MSNDILDLDGYKIKSEDGIHYKIALLNAIPFMNDRGEEKLLQINSEKFREIMTHLLKQGCFIEAKELFELSQKDYRDEIESDLYTITPLPVRLGYPYYAKVRLKALKERTSASAILRRIIIEEINNLVKELLTNPNANKELLRSIEEQANAFVTSIKERERDYILFEWEINPSSLDNNTRKYLSEFIYDAIIAELQKRGINPEIFKLIIKRKPENIFDHVIADIVYNQKENQFILKIEFAPLLDLDWRHYLYEYPILALKRFSPQDILKFHQVTGLPGFKDLNIEEIEELKEKIKENHSSYYDIISAVFRNETDEILGNILEVYLNSPEDILNFLEDWQFNFLSKLLTINIPIEIRQNDLLISGTSIPLTNIKEVSRYIFGIYKDRFGITDITPKDLVLDKLPAKDIERTLWMLAFKEATIRVSEMIAKVIAESLPTSEVIKTSIPRAFPKLLEVFRKKKIREILEENIRRMAL